MDNEEKKDLGENEYEDEILILTDEDGKELNFALLSSLEYEGSEYRALIPVDEEGNETSDEYVILKIATDENGE